MAKVTAKAVARAAGVSPSSVSNAYNKPDQLSAPVRDHILAVAAQLGYDSTSSFIALFQAKFQVTPGAYAKREARRPVLNA